MKLPDLIQLKQSLIDSLKIVDGEIDSLCGDSQGKKQVQYFSDNRLVHVDKKTLAMAYILSCPDITVDELSRKVGVNKVTLYRWESVSQYLKSRAKMQRSIQLSEEK